MSRHLLHVGYPKTGSTFLQAWFEHHPELNYVSDGLAGFHNASELSSTESTAFRYHVTSCEDLAWPVERGTNPKIGLVEEGTNPPQLAELKPNQALVCAVLRDIYPGSLILIVTRGFRGMIFSSYSQYVRTGGVLSVDQMYQALIHYLQDDKSHYYDFDYLIGCYETAFGADNVMVLPYEMLRDDPGAFLTAVESRLGLSCTDHATGTLNPALSATELFWYPRITGVVQAISGALGHRLGQQLFARYLAMMGGPKLSVLVRALQRLRPRGGDLSADHVPPEVLSYCRGKASTLGGRADYGPYRSEYLLN